MNTITNTYSNITSEFLNNTYPKTQFSSGLEAPTKSYQKLTPVINTRSTDTFSQPSETNKDSDKRTPENGENNKTNISGKDQLFSQAEIKLIEELKKNDMQVRQHEMAHIAAGGRHITSGANFTYQRGPDGKKYAVSGEVGIDTSPVPGDPEATIKKMRQVKNAALAPADPSSQDLKVAANATSELSKALSELMISQIKDKAADNEKKVFGSFRKAADSYQKVSTIHEKESATFQIAV
ncbi:MAG: putative metalloprotease CJM1_0395 family protein [Desulfobacula sp.]|jgi:hypothetical protein